MNDPSGARRRTRAGTSKGKGVVPEAPSSSTAQHWSGVDAVLEPGAAQQLNGADVLRVTLCWAAAAHANHRPSHPPSARVPKPNRSNGSSTNGSVVTSTTMDTAASAVLDATISCFGAPNSLHHPPPQRTSSRDGGDATPRMEQLVDYVSVARPYAKYMAHHRRKHLEHHNQHPQQLGSEVLHQPHPDGYFHGDTFEINLSDIPHDVEGLLLSAVLYNRNLSLADLLNLHVRVESVTTPTAAAKDDLCSSLVLQANALCTSAIHCPEAASIVACMIRRRYATNVDGGGASTSLLNASASSLLNGSQLPTTSPQVAAAQRFYWELVCLDELQESRDIGVVHEIVRQRGLCDGEQYLGPPALLPFPLVDPRQCAASGRPSNRRGSDALDTDDDEESSALYNRSTSVAACGDATTFLLESPRQHHPPRGVERLLATVPRVVREGRRVYNVGRPVHAGDLVDDYDTSDDEQTVVASMKAVAPRYDGACVVRFGHGTYNVGSEYVQLKRHYMDHRVAYEAAESGEAQRNGGDVLWRHSGGHHAPSTGPGSASARVGGGLTPSYSPLQAQKALPVVMDREFVEDPHESEVSPLKPILPSEMASMTEVQRQRQASLQAQMSSRAGATRSPFSQSMMGRSRRGSMASKSRGGTLRQSTSGSMPIGGGGESTGPDPHAPTPFKGETPRSGTAHHGAARLDSRGSVRGGGASSRTTSRSGLTGGHRQSTPGTVGDQSTTTFPALNTGAANRKTSLGGLRGAASFGEITPSILVSPLADAAQGAIPVHYQQQARHSDHNHHHHNNNNNVAPFERSNSLEGARPHGQHEFCPAPPPPYGSRPTPDHTRPTSPVGDEKGTRVSGAKNFTDALQLAARAGNSKGSASNRTSPRESSIGGGDLQLSRDVVAALSLPPPTNDRRGGEAIANPLRSARRAQTSPSGGTGAPGEGFLPPAPTRGGPSLHQTFFGSVASTVTAATRIRLATERARRRRQRQNSLRNDQSQLLGSLQSMISGLLPMLNLQSARNPTGAATTTSLRSPRA